MVGGGERAQGGREAVPVVPPTASSCSVDPATLAAIYNRRRHIFQSRSRRPLDEQLDDRPVPALRRPP